MAGDHPLAYVVAEHSRKTKTFHQPWKLPGLGSRNRASDITSEKKGGGFDLKVTKRIVEGERGEQWNQA